MTSQKSVAVIGAGVIGISTALQTLRLTGADVTILSRDAVPDTTSFHIGGLWKPHKTSNTDEGKIRYWSLETLAFLESLLFEFPNDAHGVRRAKIFSFRVEGNQPKNELPFWTTSLHGYRELSKTEIMQRFPNFEDECGLRLEFGCQWSSVYAEPRFYLPWLLNKFLEEGGRFEMRNVTSFEELSDSFDVVVNCTGLTGRHLTQDEALFPGRGYLIKLENAPGIDGIMSNDFHLFPSEDGCYLGHTFDRSYDTCVRPEEKKRILNIAYSYYPQLKKSKILKEWIGFRPCRNEVRLEPELIALKSGAMLPVVHNYGHGGSGVVLHWGCASEAARHVYRFLTPSKL